MGWLFTLEYLASIMKYLIYGGCCVADEFTREVVSLWAKLVRHLNPDAKIVLFDSNSPFDPNYIIGRTDIEIIRFPENVGHLSQGGGDGAGRTLIAGIEYAGEHGYTYACHLGTDMFFARPVSHITYRMWRDCVDVCALPLSQYQFCEWELSCFNIEWTRRTDFVNRYGWSGVKGPYPHVERPSLLKRYLPEWRLQALAGDNLWLLPYWGIRNDKGEVNAFNMHELSPYEPPTWLHMARDIMTYRRFLELNGIDLP